MAVIAAQAGVSVPTVSKVINGRSDVAPDTRRRVEAAIREHGYHRPARDQRVAPILELIFHELDSEWALEIVRGVERVAGATTCRSSCQRCRAGAHPAAAGSRAPSLGGRPA